MYDPKKIITDEQIEQAWGNSNFGDHLDSNKRELINKTVLKCASGYYTGSTAKHIVIQLGLVTATKWMLTKLGKQYLYAAFSEGKSY